MAAPRHVPRREFFTNLRRSGLLTKDQILALAPRLPRTNRGRLLARALVELGVLTRFQAERLLVGRIDGFLLDQYIILDLLGVGGMGRVYKARHRTMNRLVALKVLLPSVLSGERAQQLFRREVEAAARLVHPNIVTAFDANQSEDRFYLVLEYVDGPNLDQLVRHAGPLAPGLACDLMRQAAEGLQCAHAARMVHRDIKPANILVQRRGPEGEGSPGRVKVSDFGLARLHDPLGGDTVNTIVAKPNTVMGTPDFLSPEQAHSVHNTDIRSDLYSLGCTFYHLLTGSVPFPGGNAMQKMIRHCTEEPAPVRARRPDVPEAVAGIVHRLLAKDPADRFQTPEELAAALGPHSTPGPIPWAPPAASRSSDLLGPLDIRTGPAAKAAPEGDVGTVPAQSITPAESAAIVTVPNYLRDRRGTTRRGRFLGYAAAAAGLGIALAIGLSFLLR